MADEQPRSGSIKVSGDRKTGAIIKRVNQIDGFKNFIPTKLGTPHGTEDGLYFFDADFQPTSGGYGDLSINYSWKKHGEKQTELRSSVIEAPLNTLEDYELNWDHNLLTSGQDPTIPAWWDTIKTVKEFIEENQDGIYSITTNVNANAGLMVSARSKPKNTYKKPTITVLETTYYNNQIEANESSDIVGWIRQPSNVYGKPTDGFRWLVTSAPITRDGGYWVVKKTYQYSDEVITPDTGTIYYGWDIDIYPA